MKTIAPSSQTPERDYVLGTHYEELHRLGLQHHVWRPTMLECWERAGIRPGSRVMDVGAGPGYATLDLAEVVGERGEVFSVERSHRFVEATATACHARKLHHVHLHELDLMEDELPAVDLDAAWCRWVACFVPSPAKLVEKLAHALRPGGVAIFHEFADYSTWRLAAQCPVMEEFVQQVMQSWRAAGGEPNIARDLPALLTHAGFHIRSATPRVFCMRPHEEMWRWPASFIEVNLQRLLQLGCVTESWATRVRRAFAAATDNPESLMLTPILLEIIAERTVPGSLSLAA